jgi:hypothetical protein
LPRLALAAQAASVNASPIALDLISARTLVLVGSGDPLAARPEVLAAAIPNAQLQLVSGDHLGALSDPRFTPALLEIGADSCHSLHPATQAC